MPQWVVAWFWNYVKDFIRITTVMLCVCAAKSQWRVLSTFWGHCILYISNTVNIVPLASHKKYQVSWSTDLEKVIHTFMLLLHEPKFPFWPAAFSRILVDSKKYDHIALISLLATQFINVFKNYLRHTSGMVRIWCIRVHHVAKQKLSNWFDEHNNWVQCLPSHQIWIQ